ncbi:MAG TPA: hypothetical protein VFA71_14615 [Terriglobales bacterium]|nr:hypothetical protein [Terriglobales bacterium]
MSLACLQKIPEVSLALSNISEKFSLLEKSTLLESVILSRVLCGEGPRMAMGTAHGLNRMPLDFSLSMSKSGQYLRLSTVTDYFINHHRDNF